MTTVIARTSAKGGSSISQFVSQSGIYDYGKSPVISNSAIHSGTDIAELGNPVEERRFWFQKGAKYDPNAIATQPSVFDDPELAKQYKPRADWENLHRFDPSARWTWGEENACLACEELVSILNNADRLQKIVRKIDVRIMIWACIMFMALELDRSNIQQANTDNFLEDLGLTTNDYNLGNTVFKLAFLCAELPSQLVSKWVGPDRWIPSQMILWSVVASSQYKLSGKTSFLVCRALLGILQGGFIPDMILYLSYFYKHHELSIRLGFWWTAMSVADIIAGFLAFGILHLRGHDGVAGWRWLFLLEGLFTIVIGFAAFIFMPPSPTQTAGWLRGKKGWFTEREEIIMVNRVIREDPSKGGMHNRQPITPKLLWQSITDFDLWPLYIIGLTFQTPMTTVNQYFTLILKSFGFGTFKTNLLTIPYNVISIITMLSLTYFAEVVKSLTWVSLFPQVWVLPLFIYINVVDLTQINKWTAWAVLTIILGYPSSHPIQVGWNSRNSNTVRSRTTSAALYNMAVQTSGIIASNIYQKWDAPRYTVGNRTLLGLVCMNIVIYILTKVYYVVRNHYRAKRWNALTEDEKIDYVSNTKDEGNKRLDFMFAH
ncbi:hypothetical protein DTO217A2_9178 [Paecilomyces variotii]|nr:hypothetical protein DTO217A2_9178 [Paecilomyces variotii]